MKWTWGLVAAVWMSCAGFASAQQQPQRDPLEGQFRAVQVAPSAPDAAQQAFLLADTLRNLAPQRRRRQDVYVISMALWGDPVFTREAVAAEELLRAHFGAEERSIVLTASEPGPRTHPPATPTNIAAAIGHVGSLIDPEEDLVVIYVTTHGGPDGAAIREHDRMFGELRPNHLAALLAEAGIRNRIVIISACYSGAFISHLGNDNTIVLTASQHDRMSFGCEPDNDWTFFGDALFNRGLRGGATLLESFESARGLIETWERERNLTPPSNPQRSVGAVAAEMLGEAERRRRRASR
ncbi:MAG TPA: C13 family peptidase [Vitreimonas sp.]|uniref:C13 family peptidase n=1 Tax=Vitreimonas sp. TaxID=3069702 RepID=UPI002D5BE71F|nr:C13 family peptidase [Vitreimonas sp.]HYD89512.1 C13 family peptidase [Vitreimonas sp.]